MNYLLSVVFCIIGPQTPLKANPEEIISSGDVRLIAIKVENWTRKAAAGLARMKAKREVARQRKQEYYSLTFA